MARKKYRTNNLTADQAARAWADYMRTRRRPEKACWTCKQVFPNNRDHFAMGVRGRVGVRCLTCVTAHPVPTRAKQHCPCCRRMTRLVRDRHAPTTFSVHVCSTCLRAVNAILDMGEPTRDRLMQYVVWREKAVALSGATAQNIGADASIGGVARITGPVA